MSGGKNRRSTPKQIDNSLDVHAASSEAAYAYVSSPLGLDCSDCNEDAVNPAKCPKRTIPR